jgi:hypothetical protein
VLHEALQQRDQRVDLALRKRGHQLIQQLEEDALGAFCLAAARRRDGDLHRAPVAAAALAAHEAAPLQLIHHAGEGAHVVAELLAQARGRDAPLLGRQPVQCQPLGEGDGERCETLLGELAHQHAAALHQEADAVARLQGR